MDIIETDRLIIRKPRLSDWQALLRIHNDEKTLQFNAMNKYSKSDMLKELKDEYKNIYCLVLKNSNLVIGAIFTHCDQLRYQVRSLCLSYYLDSAYYRKKYMYEALNAVIKNLFIGDLEIISARVFEENQASINLLKKLGFKNEGCLRKGVRGYQKVVHDDMLFSILKDEIK